MKKHWHKKGSAKVVLVTPIFPPDIGGPASYVYELGQRIKSFFDLSVIGYCEHRPNMMKNVELHILNPHKYSFLGRQCRLLWKLLRHAKDTDFFYVQGPVVVGLISTLFAKLCGKKMVMKFVGDLAWEDASRRGKTEENLPDWLGNPSKDFKAKILQKIQNYTFANAWKIVVPSRFLKEVLMKFYNVEDSKIELIHNAFDYRNIQKHQGERAYRLMTAGRMVPHKNVDKIIEAMLELPEKYTLDIFGKGPESEFLIAKVKELGLESRVKFFGNVSHAELSKEMEKHEMFILYSSYEGLPHVILEAFAAKCPVVASNIPGTDEVAIDDETAVLAAPENPKRLAEAVRNFSWDRKKREKLSSNALRLLKNDFSWNTHIEKLKKLV